MNRIKEVRTAKGLKQADLAKLLNCSPTTVSNYEVGYRGVDSDVLCRLCDIFGCTADYLLGRSALSENQLTAEEATLLVAYRRADDRARDMVNLALSPFQGKSIERKAI